MGKSFSDLEKQVFAILASGGNPLQSNNQEVVKYWQWRLNPSAASHDLPTASIRASGRRTNERYIIPFTATLPANQFATVTFTVRAQTNMNAAVVTALQHKTAATESKIWLGRFKPAKVYYRDGAAADSISRTSRITGRTYKTYYTGSDEGFTAPFGAATEGNTEIQRRSAIRTAITSNVPAAALISFTPEKYRGA